MNNTIEIIVDQRMKHDKKMENERFSKRMETGFSFLGSDVDTSVSNVFQQFTKLNVSISMENISNTFGFSVPMKVGKNLRTGMPVRITMGNKNILVGYINALSKTLNGDNAMIEVAGRSKTGDLVDCQVLYPRTEKPYFKDVVKDICNHFKIDVDYDTKNNPLLQSLTIPHETPFEHFAKHAARNGLVMLSDGDGQLVVTEANKKAVPFVIEQDNGGLTILSITHAQTAEEFSTYTAVQSGSFLFASNAYGYEFPNPNTNPLALDTPMRYRPYAFHTSSKGDKDQLKKIAKFQYYRVNPNTLIIKVKGWDYVDPKTNASTPWQVNMVHKVVIEELDIVDVKGSQVNNFLIEAVAFNLSNDERTTTLTLCSPMKYNQEKVGK